MYICAGARVYIESGHCEVSALIRHAQKMSSICNDTGCDIRARLAGGDVLFVVLTVLGGLGASRGAHSVNFAEDPSVSACLVGISILNKTRGESKSVNIMHETL